MPALTSTPVALTFFSNGTLPQIFQTDSRSLSSVQRQFSEEKLMLDHLMEATPSELKRKIEGRIAMAVEVNVAAHMYRLCGRFPWMTHGEIVEFLICGKKDKKGNVDAAYNQVACFHTWDLYYNDYEVWPSDRRDFRRDDFYKKDPQAKIYRPFKMLMVSIRYYRTMGSGIHFDFGCQNEVKCVACSDYVIDVPIKWRDVSGYVAGRASRTKGLCIPCERVARRVIHEVDPTSESHAFWRQAPAETRSLILEMVVARRLQHACDTIRPSRKVRAVEQGTSQ